MLQIHASRLVALNMGRLAAMKGFQVDSFASAPGQDKRQAGTDCSEQNLEPGEIGLFLQSWNFSIILDAIT